MSKIKQGGLRVPSMQCNVEGDDEHTFTPFVMSKIKQGGLRVPSMQCNVEGDDEPLSLTTMKETK